MTDLRLISGVKKEKPDYRKLYSNAFINTLASSVELTRSGSIESLDLDTRIKLSLYGVKSINETDIKTFDFDYVALVGTIDLISSINSIMGTLTPRELLTVFPIAKEYDGEKYGFKDYFYTKKFIEEFGVDKVIGEEMTRFHWDYHNQELMKFANRKMLIMNAIERVEVEARNSIGGEAISFRDAVHNCMISTYDDECKEKLGDSMKGILSNDAFYEEASEVFASFLSDLYEENREKFIELAKPIYEEYCKMKSEDDAYWKREQLKSSNLSLIVNKKTHS